MSFRKDGETQVFKTKDGKIKTASEQESERYTVDDLVKDSEKDKEQNQEK